MPLTLVRVDDRLIHGQVIAVWLRARGGELIVIADDETAQDEFLADVLVHAAPPGVEVEVYDTESAAPRLTELAGSPVKVFALMRTPLTAVRLSDLGVPIDVLNIGGIGAGPDRSPLYKNVSASESERTAMRTLEARGTRVEIQIVADDAPVSFSSVDTQSRSQQ